MLSHSYLVNPHQNIATGFPTRVAGSQKFSQGLVEAVLLRDKMMLSSGWIGAIGSRRDASTTSQGMARVAYSWVEMAHEASALVAFVVLVLLFRSHRLDLDMLRFEPTHTANSNTDDKVLCGAKKALAGPSPALEPKAVGPDLKKKHMFRLKKTCVRSIRQPHAGRQDQKGLSAAMKG